MEPRPQDRGKGQPTDDGVCRDRAEAATVPRHEEGYQDTADHAAHRQRQPGHGDVAAARILLPEGGHLGHGDFRCFGSGGLGLLGRLGRELLRDAGDGLSGDGAGSGGGQHFHATGAGDDRAIRIAFLDGDDGGFPVGRRRDVEHSGRAQARRQLGGGSGRAGDDEWQVLDLAGVARPKKGK